MSYQIVMRAMVVTESVGQVARIVLLKELGRGSQVLGTFTTVAEAEDWLANHWVDFGNDCSSAGHPKGYINALLMAPVR